MALSNAYENVLSSFEGNVFWNWCSRIDFDYGATRILACTYWINIFKHKKNIKSLKDFLTGLFNLIKEVNFETPNFYLI